MQSSTAAAPPEPPDQETESPGEFGNPTAGIGSRTEAFGAGASGARGVAPPASLEAAQQQQNAGPKTFTPNGTNMQIVGSGIGSSAKDAARMTIGGGFLPTANGTSQESLDQRRVLTNSAMAI
jgi:hypothetical protein